MINIELSERHKDIIKIVKHFEPITSTNIAKKLGLTRAAIRPELTILTMTGMLVAKPKVGYTYNGDAVLDSFNDKVSKLSVNEICSLPVVVDEKSSVYDAIVTMFLEDAGFVIVLSDGYLAGIVSRKDFIKASMDQADLKNLPIGVIMTRMPNVHYAFPTEMAYTVAERMIKYNIDGMPVVEKQKTEHDIVYKVIGCVSKTTFTRLFVDLFDFPDLIEAN